MRAVRIAGAMMVLTIAGCTIGDERHENEAARPSPPTQGLRGGVDLARIPSGALDLCRSASMVRPACPIVAPAARWPEEPGGRASWSLCVANRPRCESWSIFNLEWGAETVGRPEANRPTGTSGVVHIAIFAGDLGGRRGYDAGARSAFPFDWPRGAVALEDDLMFSDRTTALSLQTPPKWNFPSGDLVLAPPYGYGGIMGDHLIFRWHDGEKEYALGLHAWEPLTEAADALHAVIESTDAVP